ncbi:MAG: ABC transporter permease subunit [Solirubrobacteraceae bacterium]
MSGEIAKLRYLALPRWVAGAVIGVALLVGTGLIVFQPTKAKLYTAIPSQALSAAFAFAAIAFAVWVIAVEFSSGTLQRTLTAEPDRHRVLGAKLTSALLGTAIVALAAAATSSGLSDIATTRAGINLDSGDLAGQLFSQVPVALAYAGVGFGFGLLARSMGGGITLALGLVFVFNGALGFIPGFRDYTFGQLTQDLTSRLSGHGDARNGLAVAAIGTIVWVVIILIPGWLRFVRGDLK